MDIFIELSHFGLTSGTTSFSDAKIRSGINNVSSKAATFVQENSRISSGQITKFFLRSYLSYFSCTNSWLLASLSYLCVWITLTNANENSSKDCPRAKICIFSKRRFYQILDFLTLKFLVQKFRKHIFQIFTHCFRRKTNKNLLKK